MADALQASSSNKSNPLVLSGGTSSGFNIHLHPLPILNISDHCTRARLTSPTDDPKLIGALLGTPSNRDLSITNSFELVYSASNDDVDMSGTDQRSTGRFTLDRDFLTRRSAQFKDTFPTLEVVGWYTVGSGPTVDDVDLNKHLAETIDTPVFLVFDPAQAGVSQDLPITIYESALADATAGAESSSLGKFVKLEYAVETGEAERIAVDGVTKGLGEEESSSIGNLSTLRNAIKMLYDRIQVLSTYLSNGGPDGLAELDYDILRQISSLVSSLPTIDAPVFREELGTEFDDVQLAAFLTNTTRQLEALSEYTDKYHTIHPSIAEDFSLQRGPTNAGPPRRRRG